MENKKVQVYFFLGLLALSFLLAFLIFKPYLGLLILAGTFAVLFEPLHQKFLKITSSPILAALLTTLTVLVIILAPLIFFGFQIFKEARDLYVQLLTGELNSNSMLSVIQRNFQKILPRVNFDLNSFLRQILTWIVQNIGSIFSSVTHIFINILLGSIALFYFLKDGGTIQQSLIKFSPLPDKSNKEIFAKLKITINSVIKGSLLLAIFNGFVIALGFVIFGVPNAAFWGTIVTITALIPGIGIALILLPASFFLFLIGQGVAGFGLLLWGFLTSFAIDNIIGPKIMGRGVKIHPLVILFSVLGGIAFFGPAGFVLGPVVLSLLFALLKIYPDIV